MTFLKGSKKIGIVLLTFILIFTTTSCGKKEIKGKTELKISINVKDKPSEEIIRYLAEEFKNENKNVDIRIDNMSVDHKALVQDINKKKCDLILTSRNEVIELAREGMLNDLTSTYKDEKINDRFYTVYSSYGRVGDKYYSIGILPYTLEMIYNEYALNKYKLKAPTNVDEAKVLLKNLNSKKIRVPLIASDDITIYNAIFAVTCINNIATGELENAYNSGPELYSKVKDIQKGFDILNYLKKENIINQDTFELGNDGSLQLLKNGDIPLVVAPSYYLKDTKDQINMKIIDYGTISNEVKGKVPVMMNLQLCVPTNTEASEQAQEFIKFMLNDKTQKKIAEKGYITGNKEANNIFNGQQAIAVRHIEESDDKSIIFVHSLPKKVYDLISSKVNDILLGRYTGKEWENITKSVYK